MLVHCVAEAETRLRASRQCRFRIPPYFALIIRAIGVLEGIALVGDPGKHPRPCSSHLVAWTFCSIETRANRRACPAYDVHTACELDAWIVHSTHLSTAEFAIVDEAYPYVAQRLLCDDEPRLQEALRYMVRTLAPAVLAEYTFECLSSQRALDGCMTMQHCSNEPHDAFKKVFRRLCLHVSPDVQVYQFLCSIWYTMCRH
jgi:hypothetical protein